MINGLESNLDILSQYPSFEFIEGDVRKYQDCLKACKDIDYISHHAGLGSAFNFVNDPLHLHEVNVTGFVNMLYAAVQSKVKTFVYASSSAVYGDEKSKLNVEDKIANRLSPYATTKRMDELYAQVFSKVYGLKILGFRYFNIFGPRQNPDKPNATVIPLFVKGIIQQLPVYINGDGEQTRDFTYIDNVVEINIKGMLTENIEAYGNVYNVASGQSCSLNYLYNYCNKKLESDWPARFRDAREGDVRNSQADISLAKKYLGYNPLKNFNEGLSETIEYFKKIYST